jgi:hypothetical protein
MDGSLPYRQAVQTGWLRSLHARSLPNQRTEAKIACNILNRMTSLGVPVSVRVK